MFVSSKHALGAEGVNGADEVQDALAQQVDNDEMCIRDRPKTEEVAARVREIYEQARAEGLSLIHI